MNKTDQASFTIHINEFISTKSLIFTGIKGTFEGSLCQEQNPMDSLVITDGEFKFVTGNEREPIVIIIGLIDNSAPKSFDLGQNV